MNRLHMHVNVANLDQSIRFYSTLFGAEPKVTKDDYAKWLLDDPAVNFAISARGGMPGVDHVGFQTATTEGLAEITDRLKAADASLLEQAAETCCYAVSDKTWVEDPSGIRWESFHTTGESATFGVDATTRLAPKPAPVPAAAPSGGACC